MFKGKAPENDERERVPSSRSRLLLTGAMLFLAAVFVGLGSWQVQRLFWKLDLIDRVERRVHADPVQAPSQPDWSAVNRDADEYRRVVVEGRFEHGKAVLVQAVTERGAGFWLVTPIVRPDASTILVNRGFVPSDRREAADRAEGDAAGQVTVTGLMRMSEPDGAFLRANDPRNGRWYSRDIDAIAAAQGIAGIAPFFIDADATPNAGGLPIGGLTVVEFRNSHLVYALTWYFLALMSAGAAFAIHRRLIV